MQAIARRLQQIGATHAVAAGLLLVAAYAGLRTLAVPAEAVTVWTVVAAFGTVASPVLGLTVLAAIGPFTEAVGADGRLTPVPFLLAALGVSLFISLGRAAIARELSRPPLAVAAAVALFILTLASVGTSFLFHGGQLGIAAFQMWVPGIGGGLTVLLAAWLVARGGEYRPLVVAIAAVVFAAGISSIDFLTGGAVQASALGWLLRTEGLPLDRLGGILPAPNASAAVFLVGLAGCLGLGIARADRAARVLATVGAAVCLVAVALTFSRSGLVALVVFALLAAYQLRGRVGLAIAGAVATALAIVVVLLPGLGILRDVPRVADEARLEAWAAGTAMWLEQPLTGHGFRSFEWLHARYGTALDAPHNEWLRFFAEGGLLTGAVGLLFIIAGVVTLQRGATWLAVACAGSAAIVFVMAGFNNPFIYVQANVPSFAVLGIGLGLMSAKSSPG